MPHAARNKRERARRACRKRRDRVRCVRDFFMGDIIHVPDRKEQPVIEQGKAQADMKHKFQ